MNIGDAIIEMRQGKKCARRGWNGKDMFIVYMPPMELGSYNDATQIRRVNDRTAKFIGKDTPLETLGYFAIYTADRKWLPGWLASQTDLLATDWITV